MTTRSQLQQAARLAGEKHFEDPKGCKRGHTLFYTSNGSCKLCTDRVLTFDRRPHADDLPRVREAIERGAQTSFHVSQCTGFSVAYSRELLRAIGAARDWTPEHEELLRREYPKAGAKPLVSQLGRRAGTIRAKAAHMGLRYVKPGPIRVAAHNPFGITP
ncbi:MAG: hypothetical protein RSE94_11720 [Pseudomonas sp.]